MHRTTWGFFFPFAKEQAILEGDISGIAIHPFFIHMSHVTGCQLVAERRGQQQGGQWTYALMCIQAWHTKEMMSALEKIEVEGDPLSVAQAFLFMAHGYFFTQSTASALSCMKTVFDIIRKNRLRFLPKSKSNPEPLEVTHEKAAFLAHMLYLREGLYLVAQHHLSPGATAEESDEDARMVRC